MAKERKMETQLYFTIAKIYPPNLQKNPLQETKILQDIIITLMYN